ncbi:GAF domain-containing sensor histidine kinase [Paraconexibacter antarcticus]|uniref:GAF domain-containing sensor histidine kinase n=1 Tax=Paraconexibacter antarcticus TaxID=2949664 RepID=A0ABY5DXN5_9ACTN|nr:GAF domain-containing sensor histidine kinase [Paraconexibacter antarcticus]UTI66319.1 GAF domain-containing sensor histidine kinase [Paraconexibacter antarcticus]
MPTPTSSGGPEPSHPDKLRQLLEIGRSLTAELDLDVLLARVLETARDICGARYAALGVLDTERTGLAQFHTIGEDRAVHDAIGHLPRGRGILGLLIDQPVPIRLQDVSQHPRSYGFPPGHPPMRGFLGAPIVIRGEAWGNLYLTEKRDADDFDDDDLDAIVVLAQWAAIAIDNARLFKSTEERRVGLERAVRGMEAARDIALALGGETDLGRILELIVKRARALVEADALLIWLVDGDVLRIAAHAGNPTPPPDAAVPLEGSTSGETLRTGRSLRIDDVSVLAIAPDRFGLGGVRSALIVPLVFRGRGLGVLAAFDHIGTSGVAFSPDEERALESFAASAATAVATARSVEAQRLRDSIAAAEAERKRWARDLHDETLQGLGGLKLALSAALRADPADAPERITFAIGEVERQIAALRGIIADLRPPALDELGLEPALRSLVERQATVHGLEVHVCLELGGRRLDPELETPAYRVAQEGLTNVAKHAGATRVDVGLRVTGGAVELTITDDGHGLDPERVRGTSGYGLVGMRERAELRGGDLAIGPGEHGGTTLVLTLPAT